MTSATQAMLALVADAFCYPAPGQLERLAAGLAAVTPGAATPPVERFLDAQRRLRLSEREELYTRTLDINPPAAPYVGFQIWGESYQRGTFLSKMNRALIDAGIETEGELPDHLIPVLRYLAQVAAPLPELVEVLAPALQRMHVGLRQADPANPYLELLDAAQQLCESLPKEAA